MATNRKCRDCTDPNCADCVTLRDGTVSRRQFFKQAVCGGLALTGVGALLSACAPATPADGPEPGAEIAEAGGEQATRPPEGTTAPSYALPTEDGLWTPPVVHVGDLPTGTADVEIKGIGTFPFEAEQIQTQRPDIFQPGHFSIFDVVAHLGERGDIKLESHFDEKMDTHVIDGIDGQTGWWHQSYYSRGWLEQNAFRMDMVPYKNDTQIRLSVEQEQRLAAIYQSFEEEVARLADRGGEVIIPELRIQAPGADHAFKQVVATPHDVRTDVLQPGIVTALDALLSLAEEGKLSNIVLTWYERIAGADPVDSYWVERMDEARASGGCGFVYETGSLRFPGFSGSHIHIPADVRVTVSPEYALWFWICL
jgi:hypothetical protein